MKKLEIINSKILDKKELNHKLAVWRFKNKKIVFTNGCFDILHKGHLDYLSKAADQGDILIIGLNSDSSVQSIKGANRPIQDESSRAIILAALGFVDAVVFFNEDTPYELIKHIQPDILVKGKDYKAKDIVGYDIVTKKGGYVVTLDLIEGYSTSLIEKKIKNQ